MSESLNCQLAQVGIPWYVHISPCALLSDVPYYAEWVTAICLDSKVHHIVIIVYIFFGAWLRFYLQPASMFINLHLLCTSSWGSHQDFCQNIMAVLSHPSYVTVKNFLSKTCMSTPSRDSHRNSGCTCVPLYAMKSRIFNSLKQPFSFKIKKEKKPFKRPQFLRKQEKYLNRDFSPYL